MKRSRPSFGLGWGVWKKQDAVPPDETAPVLSSPTDAANGDTAMTGSVSTDEANGTLYWFISTSATPPSAANLKAAVGASAAGSQAVSGTGVQNIADSGLTAATAYYTHFLHRDAAGNDSAIASADGFTTDAATGATITTPVLSAHSTSPNIAGDFEPAYNINFVDAYPDGGGIGDTLEGRWGTSEAAAEALTPVTVEITEGIWIDGDDPFPELGTFGRAQNIGDTIHFQMRVTRDAEFSNWSNFRTLLIEDGVMDAPGLTDLTDQATETRVWSSSFEVAGMAAGAYARLMGTGPIRLDGTTVTEAGTELLVQNGDDLEFGVDTSVANSTTVNNVVTNRGAAVDTFSATTEAAVVTFDPLAEFDHWWNAADTGTLTGSPSVTAMADQVGTWHLPSDGANAPTTGTQSLNSKNVLAFDGTEKMWHPAASGIVLSDNFDLFALMYLDRTAWDSGSKNLVSVSDYSDSNPYISVSNNGLAQFRLVCSNVGATSVNAASVPATGWHLIRIKGVDNTSLQWWVDGVEQTAPGGTYTGFAGATMSLVIGGNQAGGNEVVTRFACLGLLDGSALADPSDFHDYLNSEFGLSLP